MLDMILSFATLAKSQNPLALSRPTFVEERIVDIKGGFHPVLALQDGIRNRHMVKSNNTWITSAWSALIVTGPNGSGKVNTKECEISSASHSIIF